MVKLTISPDKVVCKHHIEYTAIDDYDEAFVITEVVKQDAALDALIGPRTTPPIEIALDFKNSEDVYYLIDKLERFAKHLNSDAIHNKIFENGIIL